MDGLLIVFNSLLLVRPKALLLGTNHYSGNTWQFSAVAKSMDLQPQ
jgi:hypothetical protein